MAQECEAVAVTCCHQARLGKVQRLLTTGLQPLAQYPLALRQVSTTTTRSCPLPRWAGARPS